ncbi:ATP-binding protein [Amycolatopsis endophytica]
MRVLTIALIPSVVLLAAGIGINTFLILRAVQQREDAELLSRGYSMAVPFMPLMTEERRASLAVAAAPTVENRAALDRARAGFTQLMTRFGAISTEVAGAVPPRARAAIGRFVASMGQVPVIRQRLDEGQSSREEVSATYNSIADAMIVAADAIGQDSTYRDVALQRSTASALMAVSDWLERSHALASAAYQDNGLTAAELDEFNLLTRAYHVDLLALRDRLPQAQRDKVTALLASPEWALLGRVEDSVIRQGFDPRSASATTAPSLPVTAREWTGAAQRSSAAISALGLGDLGALAAGTERVSADDALLRSIVIAAASLLLALVVLLLAVRMGNDLVRRLRRLHRDTVEADRRLPRVLDRIRLGEQVDVTREVPALDYGGDEVGEVATAFGTAQRSAVAAAVAEARLREGTNQVFLNIARRSQAVVHRQLQVLDRAERGADDPDQVELLYQLDHLSTRERRNAENLIILGGGQLTRQWRDPVPLLDIVRSAVAETEQYNRITFGTVPELPVLGRAVADLVHLLAELADNAISFSPPESRIEVRGNPVGKGAVVEIDDQGLGMPEEECARLNAMFRDPPDFGVMALTSDTRIGFFVVARLARRHSIRVSLVESSYGGIRAVVLIPNSALAAGDGNPPAEWFDHLPVAVPESRSAEPEPPPRRNWPAAEPPADGERPPLPKRRRRASLAPQLLTEPEPDTGAGDTETTAVRARNLMTAYQDGTRRGRADDDPWPARGETRSGPSQ